MNPVCPQEGVIVAFSVIDLVGAIQLDDGTTVRVGHTALGGLTPAVGRRVRVTGLAPHPLGGFKATAVDDEIAVAEDVDAKLAEHEARAKAELARANEAHDRMARELHAASVAEAEARTREQARARAAEEAAAEALRAALASARTPAEAWGELLRDRVDDEVRAEVLARACPAVRLVRTKAKRGSRPASKLGGRPDLPVGAPWPAGERPLAFLGQVALDAIARPLRESLGLPEGTLSFFFDAAEEPWDGEPGDGAMRVLWTAPGTPVEPRAPHDEEETPTLDEVALTLVEDFQVPWEPELTELIEANARLHGPSAGHLCGNPVPIQLDDDPPAGAVLLLQLESDDRHMFGDDGRFYVWIAPDDLRARRFDRAWHTIESY